jgi:hypothetical protein
LEEEEEEEEEEGLFCFKIVYHSVHYIKKNSWPSEHIKSQLFTTVNPYQIANLSEKKE